MLERHIFNVYTHTHTMYIFIKKKHGIHLEIITFICCNRPGNWYCVTQLNGPRIWACEDRMVEVERSVIDRLQYLSF